MKKPILSLRLFNAIFFAVLALFVLVIVWEQYRYIKREFTVELQKFVESSTYRIHDYFKNSFDRLHFVFNKTSDLDIAKLKTAKEYFETIDAPLEPIYRKLNDHVIFGSYDIYLVDPDKVIVRSTFPSDVGLDFKNYEYASKIFDMVKKGLIPYHASQPYFLTISNDFRRYFLTLSKNGKFFVQISHNYYPLENIRNEVRTIYARYPQVESLDVILSSNHLIKRLDKVYADKKDFFKQHEKDKREFLERFARDLGISLDIEKAMRAQGRLTALLFGERKLRYLIDEEKRKAVVYSVSRNIFNDSVNNEIVILRTVYDLAGRYDKYHQRLQRLLAVVLASFAVLGLMLYLFRKVFTQRLNMLVEALSKDRDVQTEGFVIKELKMVAEAINAFRSKLKRRNKELEILSNTDPLTNVYNRRHFEQMLDLFIYEYRRYGRRFALVIFDIDNFKQINDRYGHDIGDAILRELAEVVRHEIRRSDLLFRTGGEEFAILMAPVEEKKAFEIAEGLRRSVENHPFLGRYRVTISVGVSVFREGDDKATIYRRVDAFMYGSKERGKNRVTSDLEEGA